MYPIPNLFADFLRKRERQFISKAEVNGVEYTSGKLIDFSIENSLSLSNELELGTVIPSKLTIRFRTHDDFPSNAKIVPYVALSASGISWQDADFSWEDADFPWEGGNTDWMPLGEFYIDNRTENRGIWTYTCYDRLVFADVPYISQLSYPTSMQAVWNEICTRIGFTYDGSVVISPGHMIPTGPTGYSCRQMMGFIASANSACAYIDKAGTLKFKRLSKTDPPVFDMGTGDYVRVKQTNPLKTFSRVVMTYDTDDGLFYEAGAGDDSVTLFIDNPFATQAMVNDLLARLNGLSYVPISMPARGFPQLEQGDVISFERSESMPWQDADIVWEDADFPWDGVTDYQTIILHQVLDFRGGLSMQIEAPSVSEQQSEFVVEGSLEQQVNRLNRNAVRFDKPYYGVTHSRERGIEVQREDGKSKAVFNSDELTFYKGATKALWFDIPNDSYKFSGVIEASKFIGGEIQIGTAFNVNTAGHMRAVGGEFSGEITASIISGGQIFGTFMSGSTITGSTIQTKAAGSFPRISLSSDNSVLLVEASDSTRLRIYATSSQPLLIWESPSGSALIEQLGPQLNVSFPAGRINLSASAGVYANGIRLDV